MRSAWVAGFLLFGATTLRAQAAPRLWAGLRPGAYAVGFRTFDTTDVTRSFPAGNGPVGPRPMRLYVWYPADARTGRAITLSDLIPEAYVNRRAPANPRALGRTLVRVRAGLGATTISDAAADSLLAQPLFARRNASGARGRFPVILLAPGQPLSMPVTPEYLASNGMVVIGMSRKDDQSIESLAFTPNASSISAEADDLSFALAVARGRRDVDAVRVGLLGYSSSGLSNLAFAFRSRAPRAVAVFEGWEGWAVGQPIVQRLPAYDPRGFRSAYLLLEKAGSEPELEFAKTSAFFDSMQYAPRWRVAFDSASHQEFASLGVAIESAPASLRRNFVGAHEVLRDFMTAQLAPAAAPGAHWSPAGVHSWMHVTSYPVEPRAPTNEEFFHLAETDAASADTMAQRLASRSPPIVPFTEAALSRLALLTTSRRPDDAVRLYGIVARAFPTSASAAAGVSDALVAAGRAAAAREAARCALALIDTDSALGPGAKQTMRQRLMARATP